LNDAKPFHVARGHFLKCCEIVGSAGLNPIDLFLSKWSSNCT